MAEEVRNVELLRKAYGLWSETRGGSSDHWLEICADRIAFGSLAHGPAATPYMAAFQRRDELKEYFAGLAHDWEMMEFEVEHFVAQGDRVVMLGRCAWRFRKTDKVVWTQKADSWRFADGKAVEFFEFYDTAQVLAAVA
jgi:ketosteroid isomerase-like protein